MKSYEKKRRMEKGFTRREEEVFELYCQGRKIREIASILCIVPNVVSRHLLIIDRKLEREM